MPTPEEMQGEARRLIEQFDDLPPMPLHDGLKWVDVYLHLYIAAHHRYPPAADLFLMRIELLRANEKHLDNSLRRGLDWARLVFFSAGTASGLTYGVTRLLASSLGN